MVSLTTMLWTAALVALGAGALFGFARLRGARNLRLMRCPESGSLALVETARVASKSGTAEAITVQSCDLWPKHNCCARGCLERYDETAPGYRIRVDGLRPFAPGDKGRAVR